MADRAEVVLLWTSIEDQLIPILDLDVYERAVYYHLVRHSRLIGERTTQVSIETLAEKTGLSSHVREKLRSLEAKGCIKILNRNRVGTQIEVFSPNEIPGCQLVPTVNSPIDLDAFDFYRDARGRAAILAREGGQCFYCLRLIDAANAVLDHAIPQVEGLNNSYRNIVGCCHECNSLKAGVVAEDFLRLLYRRARLSAKEFESRMSALAALFRGDLKPQLDATVGN